MAGPSVTKEVMVEMKGTSAQLDAELTRVRAKAKAAKVDVEGSGAAAGVAGQKYAMGARQIASAAETIARTGKITGEAGKQFLGVASNIAFAFGPTGAAVGALSIFALAVTTKLSAVRKEAEETARSITDSIEQMMNAGDIEGLKGRARDLFVGTAGKNFEDGILAARRRIADLQDPTGTNVFNFLNRQKAIENEEKALAPLVKQYEQFAKAIAEFQRPTTSGTATPIRVNAQDPAAVAAAAKRAAEEREQQLERFEQRAMAFATDFRRTVLDAVGTQAERIAETFDALIARGRAVNANIVDLNELATLRDQAVAAAEEIARVDELLGQIDLSAARGVEPTAQTFIDLTAAAESLTAELATLVPRSKLYLEVQQKLLEVEEKRKALVTGVADAGGKPTGKDVRNAADLAREIQQAVDGAIQLAVAFGGVDEKLGNVLRSLGQVAGNIPALSKAITDGSTLGIISSSIAIVGALSSLFGDSPAERQRHEEIARNTDALEALTQMAGAIGLGLSGSAASGAATGLSAFIADEQGRFRSQFAVGARKAAKDFGLDMKELDEIAKRHGITLNGNIKSFHQLAEALGLTITKLGEFGDDLESRGRQAEAEIAARGITDPLDQLRIRQARFAGKSGTLDSVTAGLDLNTAEGREEARRRALALFDIMKAGGQKLTKEQLAGLNGDEFLEAILELLNGLRDIDADRGTNESTVGRADRVIGADRTQITADQASRLLGVATSQLSELRLIREALTASQSPLPIPNLRAGFSSGGGAGGITVVVNIHNEFLAGVGSASDVGAKVADMTIEAIDRALGGRLQIQRLHTGSMVTR